MRGIFLNIFTYTARKHDLAILKEKKDDFAERLKGEVVIADKGYVSKDFQEMKKRNVVFIAVKRENMVKSNEETEYYGFLSRVRKKIETLFSVAENFGLKFIRTVSRRDLAVKIVLGLLDFNFYQLIG